MSLPFEYEQVTPGEFGGTMPTTADFDSARVVILPIPLDRTTSYVPGTRSGPHEILVASSHMELWDEETGTDVHSIGIFTLPELELPFAHDGRRDARRSSAWPASWSAAGSFRSSSAASTRSRRRSSRPWPRRTSRCRSCRSTRTPTCASRSWGRSTTTRAPCAASLEHARCTQVGIRSLSPEEAAAIPSLPTTIFYDYNMRRDPDWIARVVDSLGEHVYITIDCDGLDPAIMPAVGTPEPGGLSWYETLALLRRVIESRTVVGCDLVELCPMPGHVAPNFLCAKLVYKILTYRFGAEVRGR